MKKCNKKSIQIMLNKSYIIRKLYKLIDYADDEHTLDVLVSLIDLVANYKGAIPMKSAKALIKEGK